MAQKATLTLVGNHDRREAERLDLEMLARLEAGLIDTPPASDPVSATQPAPEAPSFWQAIKTRFK